MDCTKYISCMVSGIVTTTIFQPIDVIRTRYFFDSTKNLSLRALYNGYIFNTYTTILKQCASLPTQEFIKTKLPFTQITNESIAGLISGLTLSLVSTPINTIKIPLMSNSNNTVTTTTKSIYINYGLKGFYRGGIGTLMRDVVWNGIYFPIFYKLNKTIDNKFLSSNIAAAIALCFSYPFDGIRLYRQNNKHNYNFWYGFKYSFNTSKENYKSFLMCLFRVPLSFSISHYLYLLLNELLSA